MVRRLLASAILAWCLVGTVANAAVPGLLGYASRLYVSNVAANGMPVGSDSTGNGLPATPYLTFDHAFQIAARTGQTIALNCASGTPATYASASATITVTTALDVMGLAPNCATLAATGGTTYVVTAAPKGGQTIGFQDLTISGASAYSSCVYFTGETTPYAASFSDVQCTGISGVGFYNTASSLGLTASFANGSGCALGAAKGCIGINNLTSGGVTESALACTITNALSVSYGCFVASAKSAGVTASMEGGTIHVTLDPSCSGGVVYGASIQNITNVTVDHLTSTIDGTGSTCGGSALTIMPSAVSPLSSADFVVSNSDLTNETGYDYVLQVGQDNACPGGVGLMNGGLVWGNTMTGNQALVPAATIHGILNGCGADTVVYGNFISGIYEALVDKTGNGSFWYDNIVTGATFGIMLFGSANATMEHNTLVATAADAGRAVVNLATDSEGTPIPTTGAVIEGNLVITDGFNGPFVAWDASSTGTFAYNDYWGSTGALSSAAWQMAGTNYATLAAWQAAAEPTATYINPNVANINGVTPQDFKLTAPGVNALVPYNSAIPTDYFGAAFKSPNSAAGAVECEVAGC